jgi:hypothetical protein
MAVQIQTRNGTAAQWTAANPTLMVGEIGAETDTGRFKIGDGSTAWNSLGYAASMKWRGAYDNGTAYVINDAVSYQSSSYICILASTGNVPTNATYWSVLALKGTDGEVTLSTAQTLTNKTISASNNTLTGPDGTTQVGYLSSPQVSGGSSAYTLVLGDAGDHVWFTGGSTATLTVPTDSSVAFPTGTTILALNNNSGNLTISGAGVTFQLVNSASTGNRTVATKGMASLIKVATDTWWVTGPGVT